MEEEDEGKMAAEGEVVEKGSSHLRCKHLVLIYYDPNQPFYPSKSQMKETETKETNIYTDFLRI